MVHGVVCSYTDPSPIVQGALTTNHIPSRQKQNTDADQIEPCSWTCAVRNRDFRFADCFLVYQPILLRRQAGPNTSLLWRRVRGTRTVFAPRSGVWPRLVGLVSRLLLGGISRLYTTGQEMVVLAGYMLECCSTCQAISGICENFKSYFDGLPSWDSSWRCLRERMMCIVLAC